MQGLELAIAIVLLIKIAARIVGVRSWQARPGPVPLPAVVLFAVVAVPTVIQALWHPLLGWLRRDPHQITAHREYWRLFTSILVQDGGVVGAIVNLVTLAIIATLAAWFWGGPRTIAFFLVLGFVFDLVAVLRPPQEDDLAAITAIYNDVMQTSFTIWREKPTSVTAHQRWLAETSRKGYPALVAADPSGVLGFIAAEPFRPWPGYAATWEHSIHVRRDARARGIGRCMLDAMQAILRARGAHVMVAGIDSENDGSLRFHARAGFAETGRMPEVGRMRGSWRDLVLVQKSLTGDQRVLRAFPSTTTGT